MEPEGIPPWGRERPDMVQRRPQYVEGGGTQEVTTLVLKYEDDNLLFMGVRSVVVYAQVYGGPMCLVY